MTNYLWRKRESCFPSRLLAACLIFSLFSPFLALAQVPSANFTASPLSGCSPIVVNFTDLSTNNPTSWSWNFGNGSVSTLQNPTATYFNPGTYTVTLTATNASGSNTLTRSAYITVYSQPTVNFTVNDSTGCFPHAVQFTSLSDGGAGNTITRYDWDFGDGTLSTLANPSHTYVTAGNFTVTLKVTNDKGCVRTFSKTQYIQVTPGINIGFTNTTPTVCSPPVSISFTNTSTGPGVLTYSWNFGDGGTSSQQNPSHIYNNPGTFPVTLVVTSDQGCSATLVKDTAVIIDTIITDFSAPDSVCINSSVTFTNLSSPAPLNTSWNFGDGTTSGQVNPVKSFTAAGIYQVKLVSSHAQCIDSIIKPIVVLDRPVADFISADTSKCQPPLTVNFSNQSTGAVSYEWLFGDGGSSTQQNPTHTYTNYGDFDVTLIITNGFGCTDTIVKTDYIKIRRPVITIPGLPAQGCVPYTFAPMPVIITEDVVTSWLWDFGDGNTSTQQFPSNVYPNQGTYNVTLTITTQGGCTETRVFNSAVRVGTKPTVDFIANPLVSCARQNIQFTDQSVPADQWIWDFGDGGTAYTQNPTHAYADTGFFTIKLVAINNGCRDSLTKTNYIRILPPVANFDVVLDCNNRNEYTFLDRSILPLTWFWSFGDGTTSTVANPPPHTYPGVGQYTVKLIVTNGGCTDSLDKTINVIQENPDLVAIPASLCSGDTVTFNVTNVNTANITNYIIDLGNGGFLYPNVPTASYAYPTSGQYTVTLVTIDNNGCRDTLVKPNLVQVNGPLANFDVTNGGGCKDAAITFNDLTVTDGINAIVSWEWNFGDGTGNQVFTAPPFTHVYDTSGTYSVWLKVTDASGCSDTVRINNAVTVTDPFVTFSANGTLTCPGANISWNVLALGSNITYTWDFGDGTSSNVAIPTKSYASPGVYTVKLFVTDYYGCTDSLVRPDYITIASPVADYVSDDTASSCIPFEVEFTNNSSFYLTSLWDFGDGGTSSLNDPIHYFTSPGVFPVKLVVSSTGGCKDSITKTIILYDTAGTRLNYAPLAGCSPRTVNFQVTTANPATFIWDFGDGQSYSTPGPTTTYTYGEFGNYVPKVILMDPSGCIIPIPGIDTVRVVGATAHFGIDDSVICDGGLVNFIDSTTFNDPVISYSWDFGDGGTSNLQNPSHVYSGPGFYHVTLAIETQLGCRDTAVIDSILKIVASPDTRIVGPTEVCHFTPLDVAGAFNQPDTSNVTWTWDFGNGTVQAGQDPPAEVYISPGNYTITSVATNSTGCVDSVFHPVRIHALPSVSMPTEITILAGTTLNIPATYSGNMSSYTWSPAVNLDCTTCPNPNTNTARDRLYRTSFVDSNGCTNIGTILVRVICKGGNVFTPNTFSPNGDGNNDVFYPRGTGLNRAQVLRIFNRWGEVIFENHDFPVNSAAHGWNGTYKGNPVEAGVYIYQLDVYCDNGELLKFSGNITLLR